MRPKTHQSKSKIVLLIKNRVISLKLCNYKRIQKVKKINLNRKIQRLLILKKENKFLIKKEKKFLSLKNLKFTIRRKITKVNQRKSNLKSMLNCHQRTRYQLVTSLTLIKNEKVSEHYCNNIIEYIA